MKQNYKDVKELKEEFEKLSNELKRGQELLKTLGKQIPEKIGEFSDGYHTFDDLYFQRLILFATLVNTYKDLSWKSKRHSDGKKCFGEEGNYFIVGIETPLGSYTYHFELVDWDLFECKELEVAPAWDGHTSKDVPRLLSLLDGNKITLSKLIERLNEDNYVGLKEIEICKTCTYTCLGLYRKPELTVEKGCKNFFSYIKIKDNKIDYIRTNLVTTPKWLIELYIDEVEIIDDTTEDSLK